MQKSPISLLLAEKGRQYIRPSLIVSLFPKILGKGYDWPPHSGHCSNRLVAFLEHQRKERFHSRGRHLYKFIGTKDNIYMHIKRVQLPQDWSGTLTWPPFHCLEHQ